jgi:hypothetical protein
MVGQGARHRNAAQCDHVENRRATAKEQPEQRAPIEQLRPESRPCPHLASGVPAPPSSWRWQQQRGPVGRHASVRAAAALRSTERAQDHRLHCADRAPDTGIEPWADTGQLRRRPRCGDAACVVVLNSIHPGAFRELHPDTRNDRCCLPCRGAGRKAWRARDQGGTFRWLMSCRWRAPRRAS